MAENLAVGQGFAAPQRIDAIASSIRLGSNRLDRAHCFATVQDDEKLGAPVSLRPFAEADEPADVIGMIAYRVRTVDAEGFGVKRLDICGKFGKARGKSTLFVDCGMNREREMRSRCRDAQKLLKHRGADMPSREGPRTDTPGIGAIRQRQRLREIGPDRAAIDALRLSHRQHLIGKIDRVDRPDPVARQRLSHKSGSRPDIENRARPTPRGEKPGDRLGAPVSHFFSKLTVVSLRPVAIVPNGILRRAQRIGGVEFIVLTHHCPIGPRSGATVKALLLRRLASSVATFDSLAMTRTLLIFGHGYSAEALVRRLGAGWTVIGTTRRADKAERLRSKGVEALVWPGTDLRPAIARATHLLLSIAPGAEGDPVAAAYGDEIARAAPHLAWVGYLSTTGVYGDHGGGWVDEETQIAPSTERGRMRVAAERQWQEIAARSGLPLHIFRLAGIYGPGRGPFEKVRDGTARRIIRENQYFSRIHVDDIAGVLAASIARPKPGAIYNVADDDPSPPEDVLAEAARLLGLPLPPEVPFAEAEMTPMARSFYAESKRVRNDRIKQDLGVALRYPDYRSGLRALLASEPHSVGGA